jgi:hypothetical protein
MALTRRHLIAAALARTQAAALGRPLLIVTASEALAAEYRALGYAAQSFEQTPDRPTDPRVVIVDEIWPATTKASADDFRLTSAHLREVVREADAIGRAARPECAKPVATPSRHSARPAPGQAFDWRGIQAAARPGGRGMFHGRRRGRET